MTGKTKDIPRLTHCPQCGYDLAGLPVKHACPECGYAYDKGDIVVRGWKKGKTPSLLRILAWGALMVLIIAPWRSTSPALDGFLGILIKVAPVFYGLWMIRDIYRYINYRRNRTEITVLFNAEGFEMFVANKLKKRKTWTKYHQIDVISLSRFWVGLKIRDRDWGVPFQMPLEIMFDGKLPMAKLIRNQLEAYVRETSTKDGG